MPKKTKKEKIIADLRRRLQDRPAPTPSQATTQASYQLPSKQKLVEKEKVSDTTQLVLIKKDLVKTLLLAFFAIAIELVLFVTAKNKLF